MPKKRQLYLPDSTTPFPLSRSKLECFLKCPRCFYLDRRLGISPPSMPPFCLNNAVDKLLKKEFDQYRAMQRPHPLMVKYSINAIPFQHADLDLWRSNFKGIKFHHLASNFLLSGAIDDVWANKDGELLLTDYKATSSKEEVIALNTPHRQGYKRQLEFYQYLFRQNGFKVSDKAYLVYANAKSDKEGFNGKMEFDLQLIEVTGDTTWIDGELLKAKECLNGELPVENEGCELCGYVSAVNEAKILSANS